MTNSSFRSRFSILAARRGEAVPDSLPEPVAEGEVDVTPASGDRATVPPIILEVCREAAAGNLDARITEVDEESEFAELMHSINHMLDITDAFVREAGASLEYASRGKYFRRIIERGLPGDLRRNAAIVNQATEAMGAKVKAFGEIADRFENDIKSVVDGVAAAGTEMHASAGSLSAIAEEAMNRSDRASEGAEATKGNVEEVASATQEMTVSVNEIGSQVARSSEIARTAAEEAKQTNVAVGNLIEASEKISKVVSLIQDIASQTNLLALNATIEAARAGDAGRGFAVVAHEVKELASQTAKATSDISDNIAAIQETSGGVAEAIKGIGGTIVELNEIASTISAAVEEQGAATREISRSVRLAADGTGNVVDNIGGVSDAAAETGRAAKDVLDAAGELSSQSESLRANVDQFLSVVRTTG